MNIATWLLRSAQTYPDNPALSLGGTCWASYRQLAERVARLAAALRSRCRLGPGERVAIAMTNAPEFVEVLLAAWHAGLVAVPINAKLHAREFAYILDDAGARLCFVSDDLAATITPLVEEIETLERVIGIGDKAYGDLLVAEAIDLTEVPPDAPAWIFYTSGTTGQPKGAVLSHRNLLAMTMNYFSDVDQVAPGDGIVHAAPLSHGSGLYGLPHLLKAANQIVPESRGFDPIEVADLCRAYGGLTFFFAPTMVVRLLASPALADSDLAYSNLAPSDADEDPLPGLKTIVYGGGPMYVSDLERALDRLGPRLVQIYGQGEAPMTITALSKALHADRDHPDFRRRLASVGTARSDVELRAVDEEGTSRAARRDRRGDGARRGGDGGLLAQARGDGRGAQGRLAPHRRPGRPGRGRLPHPQGPGQGPDHLRRRQHLSARGGGGAAAPSRRCRGLGHRFARRGLGRAGGRLHRSSPRVQAAQRGRARSPLPRPHRPLQAAQGLPLRRSAAQEQLRQGAENGAKGTVGGSGKRGGGCAPALRLR